MRLQYEPGKFASSFPQERPLPAWKVRVLDTHGVFMGIGTPIETRDTGVAIMIDGKKFDSNHILHWVRDEG